VRVNVYECVCMDVCSRVCVRVYVYVCVEVHARAREGCMCVYVRLWVDLLSSAACERTAVRTASGD